MSAVLRPMAAGAPAAVASAAKWRGVVPDGEPKVTGTVKVPVPSLPAMDCVAGRVPMLSPPPPAVSLGVTGRAPEPPFCTVRFTAVLFWPAGTLLSVAPAGPLRAAGVPCRQGMAGLLL